jgi:hypothetical protein
MSKVKNEHFVPKIYLGNFAKEKSQVYVYDKIILRSFKTHVKNIACEKAFYDFPNHPDIDSQTVEKLFSELEGSFAGDLKKLLTIAHKKGVISKDFKCIFAPYIVVQMLRTPDFRLQYRETMEKSLNKLLPVLMKSECPSVNTSGIKASVNRDMESIMQADFIFDPKTIIEFSNVLINHVWKIGYSKYKYPLYTSDNPVVIIPHKKSNAFSFSGIASEGIEIAYPLDPYYILLLSHRSHYERPRIGNISNLIDGQTIPLSRDNIIFYNSYQVFNSTRQLYSFSNDFDLAEEICRRHPVYQDSHRSRITIN